MGQINPLGRVVKGAVADFSARVDDEDSWFCNSAVLKRVDQIIQLDDFFVDITEQIKWQHHFRHHSPGLLWRINRYCKSPGFILNNIRIILLYFSQLADAKRSPVPPVKNK